jgi:acetylornithine/succinyldiaminopimelate/putrescine aminotransferase
MGAVFMSDTLYTTIADAAGSAAVGHGQTYSAHPVSAAIGLAALELYEGGLLENGRAMGARLQAGLAALADHPLVGEVRGRGMLAGVELVTDKTRKTPLPAGMACWASRRRSAARPMRLTRLWSARAAFWMKRWTMRTFARPCVERRAEPPRWLGEEFGIFCRRASVIRRNRPAFRDDNSER